MFFEIARQELSERYQIKYNLLYYPDQNDHDTLRKDPLFKMIAGRSPDDKNDLACQPTISRFENAITPSCLLRLEELFLDQFVPLTVNVFSDFAFVKSINVVTVIEINQPCWGII